MYHIILCLILLLCCNSTNAAQLHIVNIDELVQELDQIDDTNKILFFFTSWCGHCKNAISDILRLPSVQYKKFFLISLDQDYKSINQMSQMLPEHVNIYYMSSHNDVIELFTRFKIKYRNIIPHISVINSNNILVKDNINLRQINKYLK